LVLHVPGPLLVEVGLAQIVKQGAECKALLLVSLFKEMVPHGVIYIHTVLYQSPFTGAVKLGAGGSHEKVGPFQPFQQTVRPVPVNLVLVQGDKFLVVIPHYSSRSSRMPFRMAI